MAVEISDAPTSAASMSKHSRHERVQCYGPRAHDPWQLRFQSSSYFVTEKPPDELPNVYLDPWSSCAQATTRRLTATRTCPCALDALQLPFCPISRSLLYVHTYLSNYVDRVWTCHSPGPTHINSHPSFCIISFCHWDHSLPLLHTRVNVFDGDAGPLSRSPIRTKYSSRRGYLATCSVPAKASSPGSQYSCLAPDCRPVT